MRRNLDEVICYLEGTTMPPRLAEDETVTPAYETTTLGIGKYSTSTIRFVQGSYVSQTLPLVALQCTNLHEHDIQFALPSIITVFQRLRIDRNCPKFLLEYAINYSLVLTGILIIWHFFICKP